MKGCLDNVAKNLKVEIEYLPSCITEIKMKGLMLTT